MTTPPIGPAALECQLAVAELQDATRQLLALIEQYRRREGDPAALHQRMLDLHERYGAASARCQVAKLRYDSAIRRRAEKPIPETERLRHDHGHDADESATQWPRPGRGEENHQVRLARVGRHARR
jgi:hypothetical protein